MATETLTCAAGHTFTRERMRGRKPQFCPEHAATPETRVVAKHEADPRVLEILADPTANAELKRKLTYCNDEITSGRRTEDSLRFLITTQNQILRRAKRDKAI